MTLVDTFIIFFLKIKIDEVHFDKGNFIEIYWKIKKKLSNVFVSVTHDSAQMLRQIKLFHGCFYIINHQTT